MKKLFLILGVLACGGASNTVSPPPPVTGSYNLQTYNGGPLPAVVTATADGAALSITSGTEVIRPDGTYTETQNFIDRQLGFPDYAFSYIEDGAYTISGTAITFVMKYQDHEAVGGLFTYVGTIGGGVVSYTVGNVSPRYVK